MYSWGFGGDGVLGLGDTTGYSRPRRIMIGIDDKIRMRYICCGESHSASISVEHRAYTWGNGSYGKLGHNDTTSKRVPTEVRQLRSDREVASLVCGTYHTCAILSSGVMYSWGSGFYSKLGHGDSDNSCFPILVKALQGKKINKSALSPVLSLATTETGDLYSWGFGGKGCLGHGDLVDVSIPACVTALKGKRIGLLSSIDTALSFAKSEDSVFAKLCEESAEHGHATPASNAQSKRDAQLLKRREHTKESIKGQLLKQVACGSYHTLLLSSHGDVFAWGSNKFGQCAIKPVQDTWTPLHIPEINDMIAQISCGDTHCAAVSVEGVLYTWGNAADGRLGIGNYDHLEYEDLDVSHDDAMVEIIYRSSQPTKLTSFNNKKIERVCCGANHTICISSYETGNEVYSWGDGSYGKLGHGNTDVLLLPKLIEVLVGKGVKNIGCGFCHSLAVTTSGEVYSWGSGWQGKLGHTNNDNLLIPTAITLFNINRPAMDIAVGMMHSMTLSNAGEVYSWGCASNGRLGHDDTQDVNTPRLIHWLQGRVVVSIQAGDTCSGCVTDKGEVYMWGEGKRGKLGLGDSENNDSLKPAVIKRFTHLKKTIESLSIGSNHCAAIEMNGECVYTWGSGVNGRLGHGDIIGMNRPQLVEDLLCVDSSFAAIAKNLSSNTTAATNNSILRQGSMLSKTLLEIETNDSSLNLKSIQMWLKTESKDTEALLLRDKGLISEMRQNLDLELRRNGNLEQEVRLLDKKIKLLIRNRRNIMDKKAQSLISMSANKGDMGTHCEDYENLFYFVQSDPFYLASLTKMVPEHGDRLVSIVYSMFDGETAHQRQHFLLLSYLNQILTTELKGSDDWPVILPSSSPITKMLVAYTRRRECVEALQDILQQPLYQMMNDGSLLDLEINPLKVYREIQLQAATAQGTKHTNKDLNRVDAVDKDDALKNSDVVNALETRVRNLRALAEMFFERITSQIAIDFLPYGIRWLTKRLSKLLFQYYPKLSTTDRQCLICAFLFQRYLIPGIMYADIIGIVDMEIVTVLRHNLICIATVLSAVSCNKFFEDNESYISILNDFIEESQAHLSNFLTLVMDVEELEFEMEGLKYHEIFLSEIAPSQDNPIRVILKDLGIAPEELDPMDNKKINLKLTNRFSSKINSNFKQESLVQSQTNHLKILIMIVLRSLPSIATADIDIVTILNKGRIFAIREENYELANQIKELLGILTALKKSKTLNLQNIILEIAHEIKNREITRASLAKELEALDENLNTIRDRRMYLLSTISTYTEYLYSCRESSFNPEQVTTGTCCKSGTYFSKYMVGPFKCGYRKLVSMGLILKEKTTLHERILSKTFLSFYSVIPGSVDIAVLTIIPARAGIPSSEKVIFHLSLELEEILELEQKNRLELDLGKLTLWVPSLIEFINQHFISDMLKK